MISWQEIVGRIPPEMLGQLVSQIQNPTAYMQKGDPRRIGNRGIVPIQMREMQSRRSGNTRLGNWA